MTPHLQLPVETGAEVVVGGGAPEGGDRPCEEQVLTKGLITGDLTALPADGHGEILAGDDPRILCLFALQRRQGGHIHGRRGEADLQG